ncbi:hypothetical protein AB0L14_25470 [Streptomyces sp. NPDC052727]|uniref:RNA polymerase sigma factor n=1 Tax=Streptomyces sp. NPDC052727 TaxID=3154854 RepID=UPI00341295F2
MTAGQGVSPGRLFVTVRNLLNNHYRSRTRLTEPHRTIADAVGRAPAPERDDAVLDALGRLPPAHREVLPLSYWDGLSAAEAGEAGVAAATARRPRRDSRAEPSRIGSGLAEPR